MILLQTPKNFDLTKLPKKIKINEKFKIDTDLFVIEEISGIRKHILDSNMEVRVTEKFYLLKKVIED